MNKLKHECYASTEYSIIKNTSERETLDSVKEVIGKMAEYLLFPPIFQENDVYTYLNLMLDNYRHYKNVKYIDLDVKKFHEQCIDIDLIFGFYKKTIIIPISIYPPKEEESDYENESVL